MYVDILALVNLMWVIQFNFESKKSPRNFVVSVVERCWSYRVRGGIVWGGFLL